MTDDRKRKRIGAWCIETYDHLKTGPYLQIDFGEQKNIQYIATQGRWSTGHPKEIVSRCVAPVEEPMTYLSRFLHSYIT